jgi:AraC-like DNA-binding protein
MKENIQRKLTLKELTDNTSYSVSHFSVVFKKEIGLSPLNYFNLLKIQRACFLFDTTDMKVSQICYKIGIDDTNYFSRLFSKIMGISPREYKKAQKG